MVVRLAFRAAAVAAVVWVGREVMRRWVDGPEQPAVSGGWEGWEPATPAAPAAGAPSPSSTTAKRAGTTKKAAPAKKAAPPAKAPPRRAGAASSNGPWVTPDASGQAPASHPVKAKLSSRVYRVPGMAMYDRSVPDRCYPSPEAAEADGFTRAAR